MPRGWRVALLALVMAIGVVEAQRLPGGIRIVKPPPAAPGNGAGCNGPCTFASSFTNAEGWTTDVSQWQSGCGGCSCHSTISAVFAGHQTGITNGGTNFATGGTQDEGCDVVIAAANYTSGAGGRGLRHYRGGGGDNNVGGGLNVELPATQTVLWFSYRFRYASGYGGTPNYAKDIYWETGGKFVIQGYEGGGWGFSTGAVNYGGSLTWPATYGGTTADGSWHCFDAYYSIPGTAATLWIDGTQVFTSSSINYNGFTGFLATQGINNQSDVSTVTGLPPSYTDFDDFQADDNLTVGQRIGCLGSGG